jgi:hypothetical protein
MSPETSSDFAAVAKQQMVDHSSASPGSTDSSSRAEPIAECGVAMTSEVIAGRRGLRFSAACHI